MRTKRLISILKICPIGYVSHILNDQFSVEKSEIVMVQILQIEDYH